MIAADAAETDKLIEICEPVNVFFALFNLCLHPPHEAAIRMPKTGATYCIPLALSMIFLPLRVLFSVRMSGMYAAKTYVADVVINSSSLGSCILVVWDAYGRRR